MNPPPPSQPPRSFFGPSLSLGRVSGIPIRVHWSFSLLLIWSAFVNFSATASLSAVGLGLLFVVLVFFCVVLHELGHSLTAQRFGIQTRSITLSPIGGLAALESSPRHWKHEFWITVAGPAVNAVIALLLFPLVLFTVTPETILSTPFSSAGNFIFMLFAANVMLVIFNLIPAFPMDGGRIFRSLLVPRSGKVKATRIAARTGQVTAVLMGAGGFFLSPFLALIGIFIFFAASAELRQVELDESLAGATVFDAMRSSFAAARHHDTVDDVINLAIRHGQPSIPVLHHDRLVGVADFSSLVRTREGGFGQAPVESALDRDFLVVSPHDELLPAFRSMQSKDREVVPVMRENQLIGLLPKRSILSILTLRGSTAGQA